MWLGYSSLQFSQKMTQLSIIELQIYVDTYTIIISNYIISLKYLYIFHHIFAT